MSNAREIAKNALIVMALVVVIVAAFMQAGCAYVPVAVDKASEANDEAVRAAEFTLCRGASVGSIRRAFNDRPHVWAELCRESAAEEFVRSD